MPTYALLKQSIGGEGVHIPSAGGDKKKKSSPSRSTESWTLPLKVEKADSDKHQVFGWASVVEQDGQVVIDKQGHIIPPEELENAAYAFNLHFRAQDDMHIGDAKGRLIESMVFTKEKQNALGIDLKKVGWWVGFQVDDPELWALHKAGKRPEFSISGRAVLEEIP